MDQQLPHLNSLYVAFSTNVVILLHICWGVLWFDGWEHRGLRGWLQIILTFISHMLVAGLVSSRLCGVCPVQESVGEGCYYHILMMNILKLI